VLGDELHDHRHRERLREAEREPEDERESREDEHVVGEGQRRERDGRSHRADGDQGRAPEAADEPLDAESRHERGAGAHGEQRPDRRRADADTLAHDRHVRGEDVGRGENGDAREDPGRHAGRAEDRGHATGRPPVRVAVARRPALAFGDDRESRRERRDCGSDEHRPSGRRDQSSAAPLPEQQTAEQRPDELPARHPCSEQREVLAVTVVVGLACDDRLGSEREREVADAEHRASHSERDRRPSD